MNALDLIKRLGEKEKVITSRVFISPVFDDTKVAVGIENVLYFFKIPKKTKPGWYKFKPVNFKQARVVSEAELPERDAYLSQLNRIRVSISFKKDNVYYGIVDKSNKYNFSFSDPVGVLLCDDTVMDFDRVYSRYDGANLWFDKVDSSNDPSKSDYMRECFEKKQLNIKYQGLTFEEKYAYSLRVSYDKKFLEDKKKEDLIRAVEHAGGSFKNFHEKSDHFSVTFEVDGEEFTSHVSKTNHRVLTAGLCLNGNDGNFDLKSLVTVIREAQHKDLVHKTYD